CLFLGLFTSRAEEPRPPVSTRPSLMLQVRELEASLIPRPNPGPAFDEWQNLGVHLRKARFLLENYRFDIRLVAVVNETLNLVRECAAAVSGKGRTETRKGALIEGYHSGIDDAFQPFLRYLPEGRGPGELLPMIVYLHGYSTDLNLVNWSKLPEALVAFSESTGVLLAMPFGRSNTDYQGAGEEDVIRVVVEMCRRYPVDSERIVLAGTSMGGMGAWNIAAHYPHLFAGLAVISGRGDYYYWKDKAPGDMPRYQRQLIDGEFAASLAPNLAHMEIYAAHGVWDTVIPIGEFRRMKELVQPVNPAARFVEVAWGSHWITDEIFSRPEFLLWFKKAKRRPPAAFSYRALHPRYGRAHWLEFAPAGWKGGRWELRVENENGRPRITSNLPGSWSAQADSLPAVYAESFRKATGNLPLLEKPPAREGLCGPIGDALRSPFIFVDASGEDSMTEAFTNRVRDWYNYAKAMPRYKREADLTRKELEELNVFYFGEPEQSAGIREVLKTMPLSVDSGTYRLGAHRVPRKGNGLYAVHPSPWNRQRYAVVQLGIPWAENAPENHRYDGLPDFIAYGPNSDEEGLNLPLCAGYFGRDWQWDETQSEVMEKK
ncbi:MAG: hypothetical protein HQL31_12715, partial [Planctomycetes bacterium]|nr:hypothetical protein [Planctomycetota bacterium]